MASEEEDPITVYNEDEEDDDDEPLKDVVLDDDEEDVVVVDRFADAGDGESSDSDDTNSTSSAAVAAVPISSSSAVSIAVLPPSSSAPFNGSDLPPPPTKSLVGATTSSAVIAMPAPTNLGEKKPFDDSRKLFQKLWTDEDEIELLRGFLEYTTLRGPNWSGHHHDTTAFYDQIKSKIQLDCNKNQLVEKLRRLKKKYRTVVSRVSSGKEFVFKSPHDQTIFEISRKIWSNSIANRPEFDDDDQNPNPSGTPVVPTPNSAVDHRAPAGFNIDINSSGTPNRSRKRPRMQVEEKSSRNVNSGGFEPINVNAAPVQAPVEETVRNWLNPMLKEFMDKFTAGNEFGGSGLKGIGSFVSNAVPMNFPGTSLGNHRSVRDERWKEQMILELEVYSKRLELVQDQIKLSLEELRSKGR